MERMNREENAVPDLMFKRERPRGNDRAERGNGMMMMMGAKGGHVGRTVLGEGPGHQCWQCPPHPPAEWDLY